MPTLMQTPMQELIGKKVKLIDDAPDNLGAIPLTLFKEYEVLGVNGSCLIVTSDDARCQPHLWRGRFELV